MKGRGTRASVNRRVILPLRLGRRGVRDRPRVLWQDPDNLEVALVMPCSFAGVKS